MDIVFDDDNARVLRSVHDKLVSAVEDDVLAVARIQRHQGVTTAKRVGPPGEMISKFELRVVGDGVEIVVAVNQAGQTLLDDVEERVELANLLQSSRSTFSWGGFPSFFAFKAGLLLRHPRQISIPWCKIDKNHAQYLA